MGQVERNIKKRMARRDGLMRQVWNEVVWQITKHSTIQPSQKTRCTCQHLSLYLKVFCRFTSCLNIVKQNGRLSNEVLNTEIFIACGWCIASKLRKVFFLNVNFQIFPCLTNYFQLCVKISPSCI